jgi:hypothetical protein
MVALCSLELAAGQGQQEGGAPALLQEVRCLTRLTCLSLQGVAGRAEAQEVAAALPFLLAG